MPSVKIADVSLVTRKTTRRCYTIWISPDGTQTVETDMTAQEYADLAKKDAGAPRMPLLINPSWKWKHSAETYAYNTPDELLPIGGLDRTNPDYFYLGTPSGTMRLAQHKGNKPTGPEKNITVAIPVTVGSRNKPARTYRVTDGVLFEEIP